MKTVLVRYKTHADKAAENESLIRAVFDELRATTPAGIQYNTYKLADGVSFMHVATTYAADGSNPLQSVAAFKSFQAQIKERCVEPPVVTELFAIDAYGVPIVR